MTVRGKVALELGIIATLTTLFVLLFPKRNPVVDVSLAGLALIGVGISAGYTKSVVWAETPPPVANDRFKRCTIVTLWITVPTVLLFVLTGTILGYRNGGWPAVVERMFNWKILVAFGAYLPWALMQQTLFQFYLLGRLLVLFPKGKPIMPAVITGICYSLVHWPDVGTMAATAAAGVVWTLIYYRYRQLLPLAFSHAAIGTTFYYGVFGHDLVLELRSAF